MNNQRTARGSMLGGEFSLIPPGSEDFTVYGGEETVEQARQWATNHELLLYSGNAQNCVHGLYRMDSCTFGACHEVGMDHTRIWVTGDGKSAFLLTHPYAGSIPEDLRVYGYMHGLQVESFPFDAWYGHATLPIRLTIPTNWPLWPIERDAALVLHTQPITWPATA
jgi:hypothetical protein